MAIDLCADSQFCRSRTEEKAVIVALVYRVSDGEIGGTIVLQSEVV